MEIKKQYLDLLDKIITSKNVKKNFKEAYNDINFAQALDWVLPEIEECVKCEPHTANGTFNLMDHILDSVEEINKLTDGMDKISKKQFSYMMFFRDLVKPIYQEVHFVDNEKNIRVDRFPHYLWGSEAVAGRAMPTFGFSEKEVFDMKKVLRNSDVLDNIVLNEPTKKNQLKLTPNVIQEIIKKLNKDGDGNEMLNKIILLNIADCRATNTPEAKEKIELLNKVSKMLPQAVIEKE